MPNEPSSQVYDELAEVAERLAGQMTLPGGQESMLRIAAEYRYLATRSRTDEARECLDSASR